MAVTGMKLEADGECMRKTMLLELFVAMAVLVSGCLASPYKVYKIGELEFEYPAHWALLEHMQAYHPAIGIYEEPQWDVNNTYCFIDASEGFEPNYPYPPESETTFWRGYEVFIQKLRLNNTRLTIESGSNWRTVVMTEPVDNIFKFIRCPNNSYTVHVGCYDRERPASRDLVRHAIESAHCVSG